VIEPLVDLRSIAVRYGSGSDAVLAVDDVNLSVGADEVVAVVGESGSGKSTLARVLVGLLKPTTGTVRLGGVDLPRVPGKERGRRISMIFQDPKSSLNPRLSIEAVLRDPFVVHRLGSRAERRRRVADLLDAVGLPDSVLQRRVRELSGGQLQRVAIARALALEPELVVADEPTSALDVSLQAQIVGLLRALRRERDFALVVISHDMRVVKAIAGRILVMKEGRVVEAGIAGDVFESPRHPYTRQLLSAVPTLAAVGRGRITAELPAAGAGGPDGRIEDGSEATPKEG
jgi:peptide/nickel transport system ATP-binding protein